MLELKSFIESVNTPILIFDRSISLIELNASARALLPTVDLKSSAEAIFSDKKVALQILLRMSDEKIFGEDLLFTTSEGGEVDIKISVLQNLGQKLAIVTLKDLSPISTAKTMSSDFVANVSHEIRSPLTVISGFIETLKGPAGDDVKVRQDFLNTISKETERMTSLVSDLLSLSIAEAKLKNDVFGIFNIESAVKSAINFVQEFAKKSKISILIQVDRPIQENRGDYENIRSVFINLLQNAISYSNSDSTIKISVTSDEKNDIFSKSHVKVSINDTGEGIPEAEIERLTERFYRVDKSRSKNLGGTGLGLAIVETVLARHQGKLVINSILGKGSTFDVYLPLD